MKSISFKLAKKKKEKAFHLDFASEAFLINLTAMSSENVYDFSIVYDFIDKSYIANIDASN